MKTIFFISYILVTINLSGQITFKDGILWVDQDAKNCQVSIPYPDSVVHVVFNGSKVLALDSAWSRFKNVELISFTNDAQIPEKMNLIGAVEQIHFSSYSSEIVFPNDFVFDSFKGLGLSGVISLPSEISSFVNLLSLSLFSVKDVMFCKEIVELKSLRELYVSEVKNFDSNIFCSLPELETVELFAMTFKSDFVDFRCLKELKTLKIEN